MDWHLLLMIFIMALVTYIIRVVPIAFIRKKINSRFLSSLLYYIPYAVLSAMTFPFIFYSTQNIYTALIGTVVAIGASLGKQSLIVVAVLAVAFVLGFQFVF